jgi:hypothetical protein
LRQLFGGAAVATVRRSYPLWGVILARLLGWELAPNNIQKRPPPTSTKKSVPSKNCLQLDIQDTEKHERST